MIFAYFSDENLLAFQATKEGVRPVSTNQSNIPKRFEYNHGDCINVDSWFTNYSKNLDLNYSFDDLLDEDRRPKTDRLGEVTKRFNNSRKTMKLEFEGDDADWIEPGNLVCSVNESVILVSFDTFEPFPRSALEYVCLSK